MDQRQAAASGGDRIFCATDQRSLPLPQLTCPAIVRWRSDQVWVVQACTECGERGENAVAVLQRARTVSCGPAPSPGNATCPANSHQCSLDGFTFNDRAIQGRLGGGKADEDDAFLPRRQTESHIDGRSSQQVRTAKTLKKAGSGKGACRVQGSRPLLAAPCDGDAKVLSKERPWPKATRTSDIHQSP